MQLLIGFRTAEGAVIRILGLIESRGFLLRNIAVRTEDPDGSMMVDVAPRDPGSRHLDVLARQVGRLVDVRSVAIETADRLRPRRSRDCAIRRDYGAIRAVGSNRSGRSA